MKSFLKLTVLFSIFVSLISFGDAYDTATAHDLMYENKDVWPNLSGKEYFLTQQYEKGRVMTWAHPGKDIGGRGGLDAWNPENWLLDGEPADEVRFDENTDLVLPDSETPYRLDLKRVEGWNPTYRHVTVGKNAELLHESTRYFGNVWVKKGGRLNGRHGNNFSGGHTFLREDNGSYDEPSSGRVGQYFVMTKNTPQDSIEIIGCISFLDRMPLNKGMLIISANSRMSPGRNASMILSEDATLVLMDNARMVKWVNQIGQLDYILFGKVLGGLPERPLTQPAYIDLSYQNTTGVDFFDRLPPPGTPGAHGGSFERRVTSMIIGSHAEIRSISANPEGKLHLRWSGVTAEEWHLDPTGSDSEWVKGLNAEQLNYFKSQLASLPKKITVIFQEGASLDGVVFNDFHKGGLLMENPSDTGEWKNIVIGEGNNASGKELITRIARATVLNSVKNPGGEYQTGIPEVFAREEFEDGKWDTRSFQAVVPPEAAGKRLGIRFSRGEKANNWMQVDNISMKVDGTNLIVNGGFEDPPVKYKAQKGGAPITQTPPWENMSDATQNVRVEKQERGQYIAFYNNETSFGQTTTYLAKAGDDVAVSFDTHMVRGPIVVELYTLDKAL